MKKKIFDLEDIVSSNDCERVAKAIAYRESGKSIDLISVSEAKKRSRLLVKQVFDKHYYEEEISNQNSLK
ncbi:MAG: hypothetical protein LBJ97_04800 [Mycoplasmataceae bacterium]|jgi:hypothetical protein|nr:hypothetical protein [Mycoplasmataceae bacterium]